MELDYATIKALSSPTRIKILHRILEKEATPTTLSKSLGKSKSTISSHLTILEDAGLVEKDKEEGRRRVTYAPTRKARTIVEGRERTVKFSVASSVLSTAIGIGVLGSRFIPSQQSHVADDDAAMLMMESADAAPAGGRTEEAASTLLDALLTTDTLLTALGALLVVAGLGIAYMSFMLWRLNQADPSA